jgi:Cu-Zn family superoxide dismutase
MTNQFAAEGGMLHASVVNENVTLSKGPTTLFDQDGSSLVLHAKRDDYASQPSGDAGDRIACAVVKRKEGDQRVRRAEVEKESG